MADGSIDPTDNVIMKQLIEQIAAVKSGLNTCYGLKETLVIIVQKRKNLMIGGRVEFSHKGDIGVIELIFFC